jgi:thioredoxin-like negative regulator of GroEL
MKKVSLPCFVFVLLFVTAVQADDTAYQAGLTSLKNGELNQALTSFRQAATKNPKNTEYSQEFMMLRQVITMQSQLDRQPNATNWNATAQRLRTYYDQKGVDSLLLDLDRKIYAKFPTTDNAARLAESLTASDKSGEAIALLSKLPQKTPIVHAVLGLAHLKEGNRTEAEKIAAAVADGELTLPVRLRLARLEAGLGEKEKAISTLAALFEQTPPSQQIAVRELCKKAPEFATLQSDASFIVALQTSSKVTESACSGGSSCGTCPMRTQCQGQ